MKRTSKHFSLTVILIAVACVFSVAGTAGAASRDDVLEVLQSIVATADAPGSANSGLKVWANEGDNLPLEEGSPIAFHFQSQEDVHLTAMYLDADGKLVLLYPAPNGTTLNGNERLDLEAGGATTPYGLESLFVVGSKAPITREALGIDSDDAYAVLSDDEAVAAAQKLRDIVAQGGGAEPGTRVDLHIVPAKSSANGYTRGGIVQYFTEATRSVHRPKLELEINFETGSSELASDVRNDLDVVGQALADERLAEKRFKLVGHTDHRGDEDYNMQLSESRAESARQYLIEKYEIDPDRIDPIGMGESKPMMNGTDANTMRRNRRVELELVR